MLDGVVEVVVELVSVRRQLQLLQLLQQIVVDVVDVVVSMLHAHVFVYAIAFATL